MVNKKIWYQSFVDPTKQQHYIQTLQNTLNDYADPNFTFEVHGISPPDQNLHPLTELRCSVQCIRNAIKAEKEGYDAFIIGHFQEPGINEIKASIDMPVVGLGEASMLFACSIGRKVGLVTINPIFIPWHENQIIHYGLQQRITRVRAVNTEVSDYEKAFQGDEKTYQKIRANYSSQLESLIDEGIEVVIPAGGLPMLLFAREKNFTVKGAVILNGIAVAAKFAEMEVKLKMLAGITISRAATFRKASVDTIDEFLAL